MGRFSCTWERGPFVLGLVRLARLNGVNWNTTWPHDYLLEWAEHYEWKLCATKEKSESLIAAPEGSPSIPKGTANANNQLCGATYAELYDLSGRVNRTWIADTEKEFNVEIIGNQTELWSWVGFIYTVRASCCPRPMLTLIPILHLQVDALFMAMNTWSRIGLVSQIALLTELITISNPLSGAVADMLQASRDTLSNSTLTSELQH